MHCFIFSEYLMVTNDFDVHCKYNASYTLCPNLLDIPIQLYFSLLGDAILLLGPSDETWLSLYR